MKLSLAETATVLGKSQRQVRYMIQNGKLEAAKRGGRWQIESGLAQRLEHIQARSAA